MSDRMRIGVGLPPNLTDEHLQLASQFGCEGVVLATPARLGNSGRWEYDDLVALRKWVESYGLKIEALQNLPHSFWMKVRLGEPGRDAEIENFQKTVRNIGRAGIPVLGHNFRPEPLYRTHHIPGRGGAEVTAFDRKLVENKPLTFGREISADEMWASYEYFLKAVLPVCEEAGVVLALHPDDPPGPAIGGVARIFSSFDGFDRGSKLALSIAKPGTWQLTFCVGCWYEMGGLENVLRGIRHFGRLGQLSFIHLRDVEGVGDRFNEAVMGSGELDATAVFRALHEVGFTGCIIEDHAPKMAGDEGWYPRGRAFQTGYLQGMLRVLNDTGWK